MPKAENWTSKRRPLKKPLIQKANHCYSHTQASKKLTSSVFENTNRKKISPPTPFWLTHLIKNSHLPLTRLFSPTQKRTQTTAEALVIDEDGDEAKTHMWQVLTLILKSTKETSPKSSTFTAAKRAIIPTNALKRKNMRQKTSDGHDELYASDFS